MRAVRDNHHPTVWSEMKRQQQRWEELAALFAHAPEFRICDRSATSEERALLDPTFPAMRIANLTQLSPNASTDLCCEM